MVESHLKEVISAYDFSGKLLEIRKHGNGHINDTFLAVYEDKKFIFQRINTYVFKKPEEVMANILKITQFLEKKILEEGGDPRRETLNVIRTKNGKTHYYDKDGNCWRSYIFIEEADTVEIARRPEDLYQAAKVFGRFQSMLSDFPVDKLYNTIPDFHNTKVRLGTFEKSIKDNLFKKNAEVRKEIDFILDRKKEMCSLVDFYEAGMLPLRVTHNDTKLNNVLIDRKTGKGLCATDLDTVMPGLSLYDFGDAIRFGANPAAEDEKDLSKVSLREDFFEAYVKGYLEEAGESITTLEKQLLPLGAKVITLECAMRFLMDYLDGDVYFKIQREKQNLDRARTQLKMVEDMEEKWDIMNEIIKKNS